MRLRDNIALYWRDLAAVLSTMPAGPLAQAADILLECRERGSTVFVVGNGGSAATASHFACDLAKGTRTAGVAPFRVMPLTDNMPLVTAWANDIAYDRVFAEQLAPLVRPRDVVVAISASGSSPNVLAAVELARLSGAITIALTGQTGGSVRRLAHLTIRVPAGPIEQVEDVHMMMAHSLCVAIRERLRAPRRARVDTIQRVPAPAAREAVEELIAADDLYGQESSALAAP